MTMGCSILRGWPSTNPIGLGIRSNRAQRYHLPVASKVARQLSNFGPPAAFKQATRDKLEYLPTTLGPGENLRG
jgi:hypothetical protein